jgi:hypothetical protein
MGHVAHVAFALGILLLGAAARESCQSRLACFRPAVIDGSLPLRYSTWYEARRVHPDRAAAVFAALPLVALPFSARAFGYTSGFAATAGIPAVNQD